MEHLLEQFEVGDVQQPCCYPYQFKRLCLQDGKIDVTSLAQYLSKKVYYWTQIISDNLTQLYTKGR